MQEKLIEYLSSFVTEKRITLFKENISHRTKYLTIAMEDIYQPHNASAVLRTCDCFGIQDVHIIENKNKYKVRVVHDSKPETNTYPIILDASASHDPDAGDKLTYEWIQTSGVPVSLKPDMNTAIVSFEGTPGEYSFELVITDNYGAKTRKVKSVKIHPEPNETPIVKIKVRQGKSKTESRIQ